MTLPVQKRVARIWDKFWSKHHFEFGRLVVSFDEKELIYAEKDVFQEELNLLKVLTKANKIGKRLF